MARVRRQTVDLSAYPDLVVIYVGMQATSLRGLLTLLKLNLPFRKIRKSPPDGLLLHEDFVFLQFPPHGGVRQYWRDYDSMEAWTRELPHQGWWREFLKNPKGTGFWNEIHPIRGGITAIYDNMRRPPGLATFATLQPAQGRLFSARSRLTGEASKVAPVYEEDDVS